MRDQAASDLVGTLLLVLVAVVLASVLAVAVGGSLMKPQSPAVSFSMSPVAGGDARATLIYGDGQPLALSGLRLTLARANGTQTAPVSPANWTTRDPMYLVPGDSWSVNLTPTAGMGETIRVLVVDAQSNTILADLSQSGSGVSSALAGLVNLTPTLSPSGIIPDGTTSTLLTVRLSSPSGALTVGSVEADLTALLAASGAPARTLTLSDSGSGGDAVGGDGIWSALVVPPLATPPGSYEIPVKAMDASGAYVANSSATLTVLPGANVAGASHVAMGTRLTFPTSANLTYLHLRNWTWDSLYPSRVAGDVAVLHVAGGNSSTWSAALSFNYLSSAPCLSAIAAWTSAKETDYAAPGGCVRLASLDLDLLNLTGSGWSVLVGSPDPQALYPAAAVNGTAVLSVPYLGEDNMKGTASFAQSQGMFGFDVVVR